MDRDRCAVHALVRDPHAGDGVGRGNLRRDSCAGRPNSGSGVSEPLYPSLYQINTRVWLTELSRPLARPATLDDIPDDELDRVAKSGFDWVWLLSVWRTGSAGQQISRSNPSGGGSSRRRCRI